MVHKFLLFLGGLSFFSLPTQARMIPANTRGNPGFSYLVHSRGSMEGCQATLISASNGRCLAATAAHCLTSGIHRAMQIRRAGFWRNAFDNTRTCTPATSRRGAVWGQAVIETADFGRVNATLFVNPEYIRTSNSRDKNSSEDTGLIMFSCPNGPGRVPVVPLADSPLRQGESVLYGKVMGGREGLYRGTIFREPNVIRINDRAIGEERESVLQPPQFVIQQGDSGGPLLRLVRGGLQLAGVLSSSDAITPRRPIGHYATNQSMNFIRCLLNRYGSDPSVVQESATRPSITHGGNPPNAPTRRAVAIQYLNEL